MTALCKPRRKPSPKTDHTGTLILFFPDSGIVRKYISVLKPHSLWYFVMAAWPVWDREHIHSKHVPMLRWQDNYLPLHLLPPLLLQYVNAIAAMGWEIHIQAFQRQCSVCICQPSSPDIAPLDFHLFWSLQNSLNRKNFNSLEDCKKHLEQLFAQKDKKFWEDRIMKLPERWQKVMEQNV